MQFTKNYYVDLGICNFHIHKSSLVLQTNHDSTLIHMHILWLVHLSFSLTNKYIFIDTYHKYIVYHLFQTLKLIDLPWDIWITFPQNNHLKF